MTARPDDARHLSLSNLDLLWSDCSPFVLPMPGCPSCQLLCDPISAQITLVTDYQTPVPNLATFKNIGFTAISRDGRDYAEITVEVDGNLHAAYGLLTTIVDNLQLDAMPLAPAVTHALARHKDLSSGRTSLSIEQEIGLMGELLFVEHLIQTMGAGPAITAWQGPLGEEHDFVFDDFHIEIKTTQGERRHHLIRGLTQLVPVGDIQLSLISVQLTRATPATGRTLPTTIAQLRHAAGGHSVDLDQRLNAQGWHDSSADLHPVCWTLRTVPLAYQVSGDFPALTPDRVRPTVPNLALISQVSYRIDLTDRRPDPVPEPARTFVEPKGP